MVTLSDAAPAPYTRSARRSPTPLARRAGSRLAPGRALPGTRSEARHLSTLGWAHAAVLLAVGVAATGRTVAHASAGAVLAACGILAMAPGRRAGPRQAAPHGGDGSTAEDDTPRTELGRLGGATAQGLPLAQAPLSEAREPAGPRRPDVAGLLPAQREPTVQPVAARR